MRAGEESGAQNNGARRRPAGDGGCSGAASGLALPIIELGEAEGGVESSGHEKMPFTVRPRGWTTDGSSQRGNDFALLSLPVVVFCGTRRKSNDREVFGY